MLKGMGWFVGCCLLVAATASANAPVSQDSQFVTGKAAFEKRSTIVPMLFCEGELCPQSEPYWVLVLRDDRGCRYELSDAFDRGSHVAPESIEVVGTIIRPGSRLTIEGTMHQVTFDYVLIKDVISAALAMDVLQ